MLNPFKYGREVSGRQFYDRQEAFDSLYSKLAGGSANVVMYAPRRYGKTSLVKKVLARFSGEGVPCVYFDLNRVESLERFCEAYASALYSLVGGAKGIAHTLAEYLSHLHPTFSFGGEFPVSVKFDYGAKMSSTSLAEVLGLAEKIAVEHVHESIIVAFDEFQEIRGLSPDLPLEGIFRGVIQEQQNVRYVFFGSKTHMLKRMFGEKSRPFYKSAATIRLGKPPEDQSRAFVAERFASCGIGVDAAEVSRIVEVSENIPYYLQELSSQVFDEVMSAGRDWVEPADVGDAVGNLLAENADWYFESTFFFYSTISTKSPACAQPASSTTAKMPSLGITQSPACRRMAQSAWHSFPIWVTSQTAHPILSFVPTGSSYSLIPSQRMFSANAPGYRGTETFSCSFATLSHPSRLT